MCFLCVFFFSLLLTPSKIMHKRSHSTPPCGACSCQVCSVFPRQGRKESGLGSKLTIRSTLPVPDKKQHIHSSSSFSHSVAHLLPIGDFSVLDFNLFCLVALIHLLLYLLNIYFNSQGCDISLLRSLWSLFF